MEQEEEQEERIKELEIEFQKVRDELKEMLFDIRTYLMEAQTPIPNDLEKERLRDELEVGRR
ncbi:MAG: hypothetical protein ABR954_03785 [Dehalococcoidales bacterium]|jgi:hypothetical protein